MVNKLVNKFVDKNWWDVVRMDEFLWQFGLYDVSHNGKNLKQKLNRKRDDLHHIYFTLFIIKAFKSNIILVDILNLLRAKYDLIFLPTLSQLLENISDRFDEILKSYSSLINQIYQKTMDKITTDNISDLQSNTYEDIIPKIKQLSEFIKKLKSIDFENKESEIKYYLRESNRLRAETIDLLDLFNGIEPLIIETGKSAPWVDTSMLKNMQNYSIYKKITIFERIKSELENPPEPINLEKVKQNFNSFSLIKQFFSANWLAHKLNNDSNHPLIYWLNAYNKEDPEKESSKQQWPLKNLLNLEHTLSYFTKINDQGTSSIMDHFREESSFFDTLVHMQLAKKIKKTKKI